MTETKVRRFPERRLTLEEAAADPNNVVWLPAESGLRFPVVIYGGWTAVGEAFGEIAKERKEREWRQEWEARKNSLLTGGADDTPSAG